MAEEAKKKGKDPKTLIIEVMAGKSGMKQDVYGKTMEAFTQLKEVLQELAGELGEAVTKKDPRLVVEYTDQGALSARLKAAGDTVIFTMHSNVFLLDQSNSLWKTSYLTDDNTRGYFGVINIYNFLSDSFVYDRERDLGYLVARVFLNKEGHFFVQGKKQLGFLYNDLADNVLDRDRMKALLCSVVLYVLDFDLLAPPYDQVSQVTVEEMKQMDAHSMLSTGKRLGFRFQADVDDVT
ncbi:MAG: hypothetical protein IPL81_15015 [Flavobacteriales bacterium]|jgi:hypothetical protein|nr:hypothetical protein [Flavobacteriales bacterium]MBK9061110.1 hypothetical protein [Flavobacteriales bacterium]QQS72451.1 MAG: hypothetical protein IPP95_14975 [Flavobacteriales bacterium]HQV39490.1 hypothetical protein [Flavobacteriales bacterium]HQW33661.1 hypothetical protein [Flavobacteriales bacterium]